MRLSLLCCVLAISGFVHAAPIPVEAFVDPGQYSSPRLSPDGKHIAINVRMPRGGRLVPTLSVYTVPDLQLVSQMAMPAYGMLMNFEWVSNRRLVAAKGIELGLRERPKYTGELMAVNLDGSQIEYLFGYKNFYSSRRGATYGDDRAWAYLTRIPHPNNEHVIVSTYEWEGKHSSLYDIDTRGVQRKLISDLAEPRVKFVLQENDSARFALGADEKSTQLTLYKADGEGHWKLVPPDEQGGTLRPIAFLRGDEFLATYHKSGEPAALVRQSLKTGRRTVIASDPDADFSVMQMTSDHPAIPFAAVATSGIPKTMLIEPQHPDALLFKELGKQFQGEGMSFVNFSDDGKKLLFHVSSDRDPGSYYLYDRATNKADLLFSNMPLIDPEQMATMKPIHFKARDGLAIEGYLTLPADAAKGKLPLVVVPHGGPHGVHDDWSFDSTTQFLASRGYAVLQVNFRGSGGHGENFMTAGYGQWGGAMMDDIVDGVRYAVANHGIDPQRVCSYGVSFGGYASLMLAVREPEMFKCVIGEAGIYDLPFLLTDDAAQRKPESEAWRRKYIGEDRAVQVRFSPALNAERIKANVLLVHGEKDEISPIEHFERMTAALAKAGHPAETMKVPKEGHGFYDQANRIALYQRIEAFLAKNIGSK